MSIWAVLLYVAQWAVQVLPENQVAWGYMQALFKRLEDTGQLQEQTIEQLYSEAAGKFLADRFVTGTCPKCGYEVRAISLHCGSPRCLQSLGTGSNQTCRTSCLLPPARLIAACCLPCSAHFKFGLVAFLECWQL